MSLDREKLKLVEIGDAILKEVAKRVTTEETMTLAARMGSLMKAAHGIGLAAPQVGISLRFFILDIDESMMAFTNPEIVSSEGVVWGDEGCLSIPEVRLHIKRAATVTVKADGWKHTRVFDGLWARAIQHEVDHLNGILITDRAKEQTLALLSELEAAERERQKDADLLIELAERLDNTAAALRTLREASAKPKLPDSYEVEVLLDSGNGREGLYQVHVNGGFVVFGGTKEDAEKQAEKVRAHYAEVLANRVPPAHQSEIAEALKQAVSAPKVVNWGRHGHSLVKVHFQSAKEAETFRAVLAAEGGK